MSRYYLLLITKTNQVNREPRMRITTEYYALDWMAILKAGVEATTKTTTMTTTLHY